MSKSDTAQEDGEAEAPPSAPRRLASTRSGTLLARAVLLLAGLALLLGFFLPWLKLAGLASISGFGLMIADGEVIEMISGTHRFLLFAVPLFGVALVIGGVTGHRIAGWLALFAGIAVVGDGLITLAILFLQTTGVGMWLVIFGSFAALITGLLTVGRNR